VRETGDSAESASDAALEWMQSELEEIIDGNGVILVEWANFMDEWIAHQDCVFVELNYSTRENSARDKNLESSESGRKAEIWAAGEYATRIVDTLSQI
jgi:tRNA A37 threonylcarbamoyladenosine biosynthesis protein TsaE